jgi:hypothetical protein
MADDTKALCTLIDDYEPVPDWKGTEETSVQSVQQLVTALRSFAPQKPRQLIVEKPNGVLLFIGISGGLAGVEVYPNKASGRSWSAKPQAPHTSDDLWVVAEGEPALYEADTLMPVEDAIKIVAYIVEHDELPDRVEWVNARGERLRSLRDAT